MKPNTVIFYSMLELEQAVSEQTGIPVSEIESVIPKPVGIETPERSIWVDLYTLPTVQFGVIGREYRGEMEYTLIYL